jgi:hypothetical protein
VLLTTILPVAPVAAAETKNLAGRPIINGWCHGLAYGIVDNDPVLFTAHHCRNIVDGVAVDTGDPVNNQNGVKIGVWGPNAAQINRWDLAYIKLDNGDWPVNRNRIYRGAVSGNDYWTITAQPANALDCNGTNWDNLISTIYQNYQANWTTTTPYRQGTTLDYVWVNGEECLIETSLTPHSTCCDSGTPWIHGSATNKLWAVGTYKHSHIEVTPVARAMYELDQHYADIGDHVGAWMCTSSTDGAC